MLLSLYIFFFNKDNSNLKDDFVNRFGNNVSLIVNSIPSGDYWKNIKNSKNGHHIFTYDSNNMLAGITYNNKEYFYARDILGNIYGIINSSGNYIIKYDYNAYGEVTKNILALSGDDLVVANHNPFMYKGYYYDSDLECYYLKSRFYMPSICRFISPDDHSYLDYEDLNGKKALLDLKTYEIKKWSLKK